jgi:prolipoprotein diacylglyceryltransferase
MVRALAMPFPFYLEFLGLRVHPHPVFEAAGYILGFRLFLALRRRWLGSTLPLENSLWILAGCIAGALIGSRVLASAEWPGEFIERWREPATWIGGKTIVGGILGGWIGVEQAKRRLGITAATGDIYVFPLILGMSLGRVGCFLTGLTDRTHGTPTSLPWGVDFGDGIARHPTQLYEIIFLLALGVFLALRMNKRFERGEIFRLFVASYLLFRFVVEFIKPHGMLIAGLGTIQIASLAGAAYCFIDLRKLRTGQASGT